MIKTLTLNALALTLAGCETLAVQLTNRVTCAAGKDQAAVISWWGPIGLASKLDAKDRQIVCATQGETK